MLGSGIGLIWTRPRLGVGPCHCLTRLVELTTRLNGSVAVRAKCRQIRSPTFRPGFNDRLARVNERQHGFA